MGCTGLCSAATVWHCPPHGQRAPAAFAAFSASRQATFGAPPPDPRQLLLPCELCTYHRWFSHPMGCKSASYWDILMGTAKLQRHFRSRMGCHRLPIEQGHCLQLSRVRRRWLCCLCGTGQFGREWHMLLECTALSDITAEFAEMIPQFFGVMARLVWAKVQARIGRGIQCNADRHLDDSRQISLGRRRPVVDSLPRYIYACAPSMPCWCCMDKWIYLSCLCLE